MIRTPVFYAVLVLSTLVFSMLGLAGGLVRARPGWYDWIHRAWGRVVLGAAGVDLDMDGLEHLVAGRGQIIVANHQSILDIWTLMVGLPASLRFVAKAELARIPIFAPACRAAGHVFIDRGKPSQALERMRAARPRLHDEGLTLVLFPEGTRSEDGGLGGFKRGAFAMAIETGAALVACAIDGGRYVLPRGGRAVRPGRIALRLAPPVPLEGLTAADRDRLVSETRHTVAELLADVRACGPDPTNDSPNEADVGGDRHRADPPPVGGGVEPGTSPIRRG